MARLAASYALLSEIGAVTLRSSSVNVLIEDDSDSKKLTPVQRVVKLLTDMKTQMEKEVKEDVETYDKMVCWCETTEKEKKKAVADADAAVDELMAQVEGGASLDGSLSTRIEQLKKDLKQKKEALDQAETTRAQEHGTFSSEEKTMIMTLTNLKNAMQVLSKHQSGLLQITPAVEDSVNSILRSVSTRHEDMMLMQSERLSYTGTKDESGTAALLQAGGSLDNLFGRALRGGSAPVGEVPPAFAAKLLSKAVKELKTSFAQAPNDNFNKKATHKKAYEGQTSGIFGILNKMKDDFESNLSISQKEEMLAMTAFKELKAAYNKEIELGSTTLDRIENEYSTTVKAVADAKENLEMTRRQRTEDVKFLSDMRVQCQSLDREFEVRRKARNEELMAVSETLSILTSDDAKDLLAKTSKGGAAFFLQVNATNSATNSEKLQARNRASQVLLDAALKLRNSRDFPDDFMGELNNGGGDYQVYKPSETKPHDQLAALSVQVKLDAFGKVKTAIDGMVADLQIQQAEEVKVKSECTGDMNTNEKETFAAEQEEQTTSDKVEDLKESIDKLSKGIAGAKKEIKDTQIEVKKASQLREQENKNFQESVADERAVQTLLQKALDRLNKVYKSPSLEQTDDEQAPPMKFKEQKKNKGGSPVVSLLEQIIGDSKALETDAMDSEKEAQANYEKFVQDSTATINALTDAISGKTEGMETDKANLVLEESHADGVLERLESLSSVKGDLHEQCDFILQNFDIRQKARLQEIDAMQKAKAYLEGMKDDDDA